MAARKFDMHEIVDKINKNDIAFFDNLPDHEVRQLAPFIIMKWITGTRNGKQIKITNDLVNTVCFQLYSHPRLLYKLLMATSISSGKIGWQKRPSKKKESETLKVISAFHNCSWDHASMYLKLFGKDDILDMAERLGIDKETMTKLKKELDG